MLEYLPLGHSEHAAVEPTFSEYFPAGHSEHDPLPLPASPPAGAKLPPEFSSVCQKKPGEQRH
jgi:hypothetical protein